MPFPSAVGFAAMLYGEDHNRIAEIMEADPVVAAAQSELWRLGILKAFNIAFAAGEITSQRVQNAERGSSVD